MGRPPEPQSKVIIPTCWFNPHKASLEVDFYEGYSSPLNTRARFRRRTRFLEPGPRGGYEVITVPIVGRQIHRRV